MLPINDLKRHYASCAESLRAAALRVLDSGYYVLGPEVAAFESEFAAFCGSRCCVGLANGTDAIELALRAVGVSAKDRVVTVANAGLYTTTAIAAICAEPLYCDVDPASHTLAASALQAALASHPVKAVVVTHLYGKLAEIETLQQIAAAHGVALIEDCAQAHGAEAQGRRAGTFGAIGCFSFYPTKNLGALGDGGAIVTADASLAERVRQLRQYGWSSKYRAELNGGRNSRLDELQAALLRVKLPHLERWNARRRAIAVAYSTRIEHRAIQLPPPAGADHVAHLYVLRTSRRTALREHLAAQGIATDIHYPTPDYAQPAYVRAGSRPDLPVTERLAAEVLTLPCFPEMSDAEVEQVIAACRSWPG